MSQLRVKTVDGDNDAGETASQHSDPGNLISPDPRRGPAQPLSPKANSAVSATDSTSKPVPIPSPKENPQTVALNATAEGAALPIVGSPEQYLLRARNLPPRPGELIFLSICLLHNDPLTSLAELQGLQGCCKL